MLRRNINKILILILGILFCSVGYSINISYTNENRIKQYEPSTIEWQPIEQCLDTTNNNKNEINTAIDPTSTISYDLRTGIETITESKSSSNSDNDISIENNQQAYEEPNYNTPKPATVIGTDSRQMITPTTTFPWNSICKLIIISPDDTVLGGSGVLIDSFHVLTAGHNVYIWDYGIGWAKSIKVVPGKDGDSEPYGRASATYYRTYTNWTTRKDTNADWALITLDHLIGADAGIMAFTTFELTNPIYKGFLNNAGYPINLDDGVNMYYDWDTGFDVNGTLHWYNMDTTGGHSGGPVWIKDGPNRYVISIHTWGGTGTGGSKAGTNHGTRINEEKFNRLHAWLGQDAIPDMVESDAGCSSSPVGGNRELEAWCEVRNIGSGETGEITVKYYASEDKKIKDSDFLLGKDKISSIPPLGMVESSWKGHIYDLPEGEYYIGFIIDENDDVIEFDEDNNKGLCSSDPIKVRYDFIIQFFTSMPGFITIGSVALISIGTILIEKKLIVKR